MDKGKSKSASAVKEAKQQPDGLSKKERRALKVQEKGQQLCKTPQVPQETKNVDKPKPVPVDIKKVVEPPKPVGMSEKEKRKLEWDKKMAEQKAGSGEKESLSKAELKNKRREQQEAQRLAKLAAANKTPSTPAAVTVKKSQPSINESKSDPTPPKVKEPSIVKTVKKSPGPKKLQIVSHLYSDDLKRMQYETSIVNYKNVHPIFMKLGVQYSKKIILGSNARCLALLSAIKCLVQDLKVNQKYEYTRYLETVLDSCVDYLQYCRPFAVSMSTALRSFKVKLQNVRTLEENTNEKQTSLHSSIETYVRDDISKAGEAISISVNEKIVKGDTILTYGCSSLIKRILLDAHAHKKTFKVIIVDARPFYEGRQMLQRLVAEGIECIYVQMNALIYVMPLANKVLLGAHALLTNGYVMSRIGTAQVALVAEAFNKPVLVCCETYKFSERVQTDSFVYNELGETDFVADEKNLSGLNLLYDVTPPNLVTAVVTELAILPCTSVPVVLRVKPTDFV